ncbi:hypothetical protein PV04_09046 [Phialophora macrospora]|uniref:Uncharacterized protein n=1 Tax=Phialophora macrospora TaxID=1851006 RepID=A0A0D2F7W2_9EURO|nr:hypothetical protein PV04_09046 [Phialophora macrospora]
MDTGLRKLWSRRKSKGNDGRKDSGVSSLRNSQSTEKTQHSSNTSPRSVHVRNISTDHEKSQFSPAISARLQSALGVVSRPSTSWSGPATDGSGSLLNAVNRAADAVAKAEQDYQYSAERYARDHVRPKTPRYIDIFSLSSSNSPNPRPGYNEDVAERNLDLARVALEGTHYHYVPSSKYQEEVATRNAHPSLPGSPATAASVRQAASAYSNHPRSPSRFEGHSFSRQSHHTQDSTGLHSRQDSHGSGGSQQRARDLQVLKESISSLPCTQTPIAPVGGTQDHKSASSSPEVPARYPRQQLRESQSHEEPADALSSYQLSTSEVTQMRSADQPSFSQSPDYSIRPPSSLSNRAINLPHRKILDLTGDVPEAVPEGSPSNYSSSPVLEHARVDMMRRLQGPAISSSSTERTQAQSNSIQPAATSPPASANSPASAVVAQPRAPSPATVSEQPRSQKSTADTHFTSSFTPIITIASASPRTSVVMERPAVSDAVKDAKVNPETGGSQKQDEVSLASDPLPSSHDGLAQSRVAETAIPSWKETVPTSTTALDSNEVGSLEREASINQKEDPTRGPEPVPVLGPYIHLSQKSPELASTSSGASGVSMRDFANAATKPALTSVPEDAEVDDDGDALSTASGANPLPRRYSFRDDEANGHIHRPPLSQPTFDESEFAQKQAEAREALIRLQLSLNENFLAKPSPTSVARSTGSSPPKHTYSFSDGRPAAPSSIFSQIRESSPTPVDTQAKPDHSASSERGETSYHHLTTVSQDHHNAEPLGETVMRSMGKVGQKSEKARHGAEMDLNGPGPSIINDAPRQPLPLPPPLHLTDHPFQPRFHPPQPVVPPSPGEISLSNFPIPVSSPRQSVQKPPMASPTDKGRAIPRPASQNALQHAFPSSTPGMKERILRRQASTRSQASSISQFSIPFHMIPDRSSSIRDRSVMEDDDE